MTDFYNSINMLERIAEYRQLDLKTLTLEDTKKLFAPMFSIRHLIISNLGTTLFRVRKITKGNPHKLKKDVWSPPAEYVKKIGRLNNIGESIFYSALDPITAIKEAQIKPGEEFSLSIYRLIENPNGKLSTINIAIPAVNPNWSINQRIYLMILHDFMFNEFTRPVGIGTEYQYKASCAVTSILLEDPNKDSFLYPSIIDYSKRNFAITNDSASKRVTLQEVVSFKLEEYSDNNNNNPIITSLERGLLDKKTDDINYVPFIPKGQKVELRYDTFFSDVNYSESVISHLKEYLKDIKEHPASTMEESIKHADKWSRKKE